MPPTLKTDMNSPHRKAETEKKTLPLVRIQEKPSVFIRILVLNGALYPNHAEK